MKEDIEVYIKEGFQKFRPDVCSVETITLKPIPRYISFVHKASNNPRTSLEIMRETASRELAKKIVDSLVYKKEYKKGFQGDETIYTFSIKDYSIKESEVKQQIIDNLRDERNTLSTKVNELLDENLQLTQLVYINNYNSRSLFQKIKDYILYRKEFNLNLEEEQRKWLINYLN